MTRTAGRKAVAALVEGVTTGGVGAGLAWVVLSPLEAVVSGTAMAGTVLAGLNGSISGAAGIYSWRRVRGWACFVMDSTWGLAGVSSGLLLHLANFLHPKPSYMVDMSHRADRHVYEGGFSVRPGFALALGNVVSGAGGVAGLRGDSARVVRRRKLVDVHEGVHLFQNRLLGPVYPLVYLGWMVSAALAGLVVGLAMYRAGDRPRIWPIIETMAYYDNPFEYWAYRRDGYWPPRGADPRFVWGPGRRRGRRR